MHDLCCVQDVLSDLDRLSSAITDISEVVSQLSKQGSESLQGTHAFLSSALFPLPKLICSAAHYVLDALMW